MGHASRCKTWIYLFDYSLASGRILCFNSITIPYILYDWTTYLYILSTLHGKSGRGCTWTFTRILNHVWSIMIYIPHTKRTIYTKFVQDASGWRAPRAAKYKLSCNSGLCIYCWTLPQRTLNVFMRSQNDVLLYVNYYITYPITSSNKRYLEQTETRKSSQSLPGIWMGLK